MAEPLEPCQLCLGLALAGSVRTETVMPLRGGGLDPLSKVTGRPCCVDCQAADALWSMSLPTFLHARIAVGNDRQERLRLPSLGVHYGLPKATGLMQNEFLYRSMKEHHEWLDQVFPQWCDGEALEQLRAELPAGLEKLVALARREAGRGTA